MKPAVIETPESYTGAAYIFVEETTGNNAIIVCPGAAVADLAGRHRRQRGADPLGRRVRHAAGAADRRRAARARDRAGGRRDDDPQSGAGGEAAGRDLRALRLRHAERDRGRGTDRHAGGDRRRCPPRRPTGCSQWASARRSSRSARRARCCTRKGQSEHVPAVRCRAGGRDHRAPATPSMADLPRRLSRGMAPLEAVRFACAVAGISVTRPGTAPSMPTLAEVEALLGRNS